MDVPGPAESIIRPMMEVPPTVSPPRVTQTSASKRSTVWNEFCRSAGVKAAFVDDGNFSGYRGPAGLSARHWLRAARRHRSFAGENPTGDGDVFAAGFLCHGDGVGERSLLAHLGEA